MFVNSCKEFYEEIEQLCYTSKLIPAANDRRSTAARIL